MSLNLRKCRLSSIAPSAALLVAILLSFPLNAQPLPGLPQHLVLSGREGAGSINLYGDFLAKQINAAINDMLQDVSNCDHAKYLRDSKHLTALVQAAREAAAENKVNHPPNPNLPVLEQSAGRIQHMFDQDAERAQWIYANLTPTWPDSCIHKAAARPPKQPTGPGATPQPIPPESQPFTPQPPAQGEAQCPLTVDELQAVKSLEEDILNTKKRLEVLEAQEVDILLQINALGGLPPVPWHGNPVPNSELKPEIRVLKEKLDDIEKQEKPDQERIKEDQKRIFELQNKPPCENKAVQLPEPSLTPNVPSVVKTTLPATDTIKQEGPKARTETQTSQGKKHPKKESRKRNTIKEPRRVAKRPTGANGPTAVNPSPGVSIDIGIGLGGGRREERRNDKRPRSDEPRRQGGGGGFGPAGGIGYGR